MTETAPGKLPLGTVVTLCFAYGVGSAVFNVAPLIVGAIIAGLGIDQAQAGILLSAELMTTALVAMGLSRFVDSLDMQRWALYAVFLLLVANAVSVLIAGYYPLLMVRVLAGVGTGILMAAVFYFAALTLNPVRMFGIIATAGVLSGAILLMILPWASARWGHGGPYAIICVLAVLSIPLLWRMRAPVAPVLPAGQGDSKWGGIMLLFALAVVAIQMTQGGYYAFAEQIGSNLGMKPAAIGAALSVSYVIALGGSSIASILGARFGVFVPLLVGMAGHVFGTSLVVFAPTEAAYITGVQVQAFFFFLFYPYKLGLAAIIDPSGRLSTLTIGLVMLGLGVGPMVSGAMVVQWGYGSIAWSVGITVALGYLLLLFAARKMAAS